MQNEYASLRPGYAKSSWLSQEDKSQQSEAALKARVRALGRTMMVLREELEVRWQGSRQEAWAATLDDISHRLDDLGFYIDCREVSLPKRKDTAPEMPVGREQLEVLALAAQGMTNAQIAQTIGCPPSTVNARFVATYRRMGVKSRGQAIAIALRNQWIMF
jgi:DNA-binding NarL/FixJ family response regulator